MENKIFEPTSFLNYEEMSFEFGKFMDNQIFLDKYQTTLHELLQEFHGKSEQIAICYNNIASVYLFRGEYVNASEAYKKALSRYNGSKRQKEDLNVATINHNLGWMCVEFQDLINASFYTEIALKIRTKLLEPIHSDLALSYNNVGVILLYEGKIQRALEMNERGLKIRQQLYRNSPHAFLAESYCNKGTLLSELSKYDEALESFNQAIGILKKIYGENHRELALNYNNQAYLYIKLGKDLEAFELYIKALKIYSSMGVKGLQTECTYESVATIPERYLDIDTSLMFLKKSHQIYRKCGGKNHFGTVIMNRRVEEHEIKKALSCVIKEAKFF